jgi:hypothetical protein
MMSSTFSIWANCPLCATACFVASSRALHLEQPVPKISIFIRFSFDYLLQQLDFGSVLQPLGCSQHCPSVESHSFLDESQLSVLLLQHPVVPSHPPILFSNGHQLMIPKNSGMTPK